MLLASNATSKALLTSSRNTGTGSGDSQCEIVSDDGEEANSMGLTPAPTHPDKEEKKTSEDFYIPVHPSKFKHEAKHASARLADFFANSQPVEFKVSFSWVSPKCAPRTCHVGAGMYAIDDIRKGEPLVVWTGKIVSAEQALPIMDTEDKHYILQIGDGFYQIPLSSEREPADWTNHSCEPNAGFGAGSPVCLTAMRDIHIGEQILFDYAMCETDERLWEPMQCLCGTASCRGFITAHDWKMPHLREKYRGYWSPHVQRALDALVAAENTQAQPAPVAPVAAASAAVTATASAAPMAAPAPVPARVSLAPPAAAVLPRSNPAPAPAPAPTLVGAAASNTKPRIPTSKTFPSPTVAAMCPASPKLAPMSILGARSAPRPVQVMVTGMKSPRGQNKRVKSTSPSSKTDILKKKSRVAIPIAAF